MRDEWYVARRGQDGNKRYGPVPLRQLRELLDSGRVQGEDLVWREGMADWQAADQCPDLAAPAYDRRGDGYGQAPGSRGYGAYGDDRPYRRAYPRQSSAWVLPVILGSAVAIGVLVFGGLLCVAVMSSRSGAPTYYQPAPQPIDDPPPVWAPPPDPPINVDPNPPFVPDPNPPFIPDPNPPPDDNRNPP